VPTLRFHQWLLSSCGGQWVSPGSVPGCHGGVIQLTMTPPADCRKSPMHRPSSNSRQFPRTAWTNASFDLYLMMQHSAADQTGVNVLSSRCNSYAFPPPLLPSLDLHQRHNFIHTRHIAMSFVTLFFTYFGVLNFKNCTTCKIHHKGY